MRKKWIIDFDPEKNVLNYEKNSFTLIEFMNDGVINFSVSDIIRSIPCYIDGLKETQRKIMYVALKKLKTNEEQTMLQFSGMVT